MGWGDQILRARAWTYGVLLGVVFLGATGCRYEPSTRSFEDDSAESIQDGSTVNPGGVVGDGGLYHSLERLYGMETERCYLELQRMDRPGVTGTRALQAEVRAACTGLSFNPWYVPSVGEPRVFPLASGWSLLMVRVNVARLAGVRFAGEYFPQATTLPMFVLFLFPNSEVDLRVRQIFSKSQGVSEKASPNRRDYTLFCPALGEEIYNTAGTPDPSCLLSPAHDYITPSLEWGEVSRPIHPEASPKK